MALETLLIRVKTAFSNPNKTTPSFKTNPKRIAVLAFEVAGVMSKLLHLWQSLSDANIVRLQNDIVSLEGVLKLISNDKSFLLKLAVAEYCDSLRLVADSVTRLSQNCNDPILKTFHRVFTEFADSGFDSVAWTLTNPKEIESKHRRMERYVTLTLTLHKEIDELSLLESTLRKALLNNNKSKNNKNKISDLEQKIFWLKQEVKNLKEKSLWNKGFDNVVLLLARFVFTLLARIKVVFGIGNGQSQSQHLPYLSRSLSASATVHPSGQQNLENSMNFVSGSLKSFKLDEKKEDLKSGFFDSNCKNLENSINFLSGPLKSLNLDEKKEDLKSGFFDSNCMVLKPPKGSLGDSALSLHYANLIIVMEKMIKSPQLVGVDARDDLYAMLPNSVRSSLRLRLKGSIGFCACDPLLANEWKIALGRILCWLLPLAHNMIRWQSERSFEEKRLVLKKSNVLLLQTLFFADKVKIEAAITELLVGLNYVWRFEREMTSKALFECSNNFNGFLSLYKSN
ncbi:protein PSK SIMULATOR 1 [Cicer arietinum]|uniref:Uncharacterized protein LOC101513257 n=1 Tax=Cicer arietinum TaxID=3827 RepID=A0A1S2Z4K8_CICAR|nr:uncharacterized protein LOC101513257 [Cicer arietinum]